MHIAVGNRVEIHAKGIVVVGVVTAAENFFSFEKKVIEHNLTVKGDDGRPYQWKEWVDGGTVKVL